MVSLFSPLIYIYYISGGYLLHGSFCHVFFGFLFHMARVEAGVRAGAGVGFLFGYFLLPLF